MSRLGNLLQGERKLGTIVADVEAFDLDASGRSAACYAHRIDRVPIDEAGIGMRRFVICDLLIALAGAVCARVCVSIFSEGKLLILGISLCSTRRVAADPTPQAPAARMSLLQGYSELSGG